MKILLKGTVVTQDKSVFRIRTDVGIVSELKNPDPDQSVLCFN